MVDALAVSGSTVYVGGSFSRIGGASRNNLAALDAQTGEATAWNPGRRATGCSTLAVSGSTVYAGGCFSSVGGVSRNNIAALDAETGKATAWNPRRERRRGRAGGLGLDRLRGRGLQQHWRRRAATTSPRSTRRPASHRLEPEARTTTCVALAVSGSTVYAGGVVQQHRRRRAATHIAALDAQTGEATAWNPDATRLGVGARSLGLDGVRRRGASRTIGGENRNYIAALDAHTGEATAWNPNANDDVFALAVSGSTVYAGGVVQQHRRRAPQHIAALDAQTGKATAWNPNADSDVTALAVSGSTVYAAGASWQIGGEDRNYIAALDAQTGRGHRLEPERDGHGERAVVSGSTVYAAGSSRRSAARSATASPRSTPRPASRRALPTRAQSGMRSRTRRVMVGRRMSLATSVPEPAPRPGPGWVLAPTW